jgi:hypothetical protein
LNIYWGKKVRISEKIAKNFNNFMHTKEKSLRILEKLGFVMNKCG